MLATLQGMIERFYYMWMLGPENMDNGGTNFRSQLHLHIVLLDFTNGIIFSYFDTKWQKFSVFIA